MPKVVIVYDSKSGNTEKMAKAVAEGAGSIKGVQVMSYKIGTRFPTGVLSEADAIIFGTPSRFGLPTAEMREFIQAVERDFDATDLKIKAKVGGVFGSYAWDGGDVVDRLEETLEALEVPVIEPKVAAVDREGAMGVRIDEESLKKCRELGRAVAQKI